MCVPCVCVAGGGGGGWGWGWSFLCVVGVLFRKIYSDLYLLQKEGWEHRMIFYSFVFVCQCRQRDQAVGVGTPQYLTCITHSTSCLTCISSTPKATKIRL